MNKVKLAIVQYLVGAALAALELELADRRLSAKTTYLIHQGSPSSHTQHWKLCQAPASQIRMKEGFASGLNFQHSTLHCGHWIAVASTTAQQ